MPVLIEKPSVLFVLDVSGSMAEPMDKSGTTKLESSQAAILKLTKRLGHRVEYGLLTFPGPDEEEAPLLGCGAGEVVFSVREGDPLRCRNRPGGPVLDAFSEVVSSLSAGGGTPLSATLAASLEVVQDLRAPASIVLVTDGAPNCNAEADCGPEACIPNLVGGALPSGTCDASFNCCDSEEVADEDLPFIGLPEAQCVDGPASIRAVAALEEAGVRTFIVGIPGSEAFADLLSDLARAGATERASGAAYFDVRDGAALAVALDSIFTEVSQGCEIELESEPDYPELLNAYFDAELVPLDPDDGWSIDRRQLTFHGEACQRIREGAVANLTVLVGCPSVVRR